MQKYSGQCLCGAIKFKTNASPLWTALCHCETCRRACSAPVVAWVSFKEDTVTWTGNLSYYKSSEQGTRGFCGTCGTQMSFVSTRWKEQVHLYAASLNDSSDYRPSLHCYFGERLKWISINNALPTFETSAPQ